jgi:hypothetical protein
MNNPLLVLLFFQMGIKGASVYAHVEIRSIEGGLFIER